MSMPNRRWKKVWPTTIKSMTRALHLLPLHRHSCQLISSLRLHYRAVLRRAVTNMHEKRPRTDEREQPHHKKPKHDHVHQKDSSKPHPQHAQQKPAKPIKSTASYQDAIAQLPPPTTTFSPVPAYTPFTIPPGLPPLPPVQPGTLSTAPFTHKSLTASYNRSTTSAGDLTYERLEFLGDAQLEHIASRLIYARFGHLTAGQQSQLRELLVKNETLAEYARAYGFEGRVKVGDMERMVQDTRVGNKGFNKVLGDVFEAYIAAVILSDEEDGFAVAEKWMTGLWAPKLLEAAKSDRFYNPGLSLQSASGAERDELNTYNPTAKSDLQRRITGPGITLLYEPYAPMEELKGAQLGQNKHYIALYLTGFGYKKRELGRAEGKNKVEAGNWAATKAMWGECKSIVEKCEAEMGKQREERKKAREAAAESGDHGAAGKGGKME